MFHLDHLVLLLTAAQFQVVFCFDGIWLQLRWFLIGPETLQEVTKRKNRHAFGSLGLSTAAETV